MSDPKDNPLWKILILLLGFPVAAIVFLISQSGDKQEDNEKEEDFIRNLSDQELHKQITAMRKVERQLLREKQKRGLDFSQDGPKDQTPES